MPFQFDPAFQNYAQIKLKGIHSKSILSVLELTQEGATVPFIARYRKEKTGNLDEVQIRDIIEAHEKFTELVQRKAFVCEEIEKQGQLTADLKAQIERSLELAEVEELYRPFKKKKKTKAKLAQEAGLQPLADWIWALGHGEITGDETSLEVKAKNFINAEKKFATYEECLRGAQHILVEKLANNPELRAFVREDYFKNGQVISEKTKEFKPNSKYSMYAEFKESVVSLQNKKSSHRYLALRRGWTEGELKVSIKGSDEILLQRFESVAQTSHGHQATEFLKQTAKIALEVHVIPSVSNEIHSLLKETADKHAIDVFAQNVRQVLMSSPFGAKIVLALDPGLKTGCKVALIDKSGRFISSTVMSILGEEAYNNGKKLIEDTLKTIKIDAIAVGNGTAGRETEAFIRKILKDISRQDVPVVLVNEAGASVYSVSEVAREEFPDLDVTVRGAISIGRRLQDPLSELVKIEPKSIGVGQYQHDVNQALLKKSLHAVVESCVNQVGVDLNTASVSLLQYVAGIGPVIAKNIVEYRSKNGLFTERSELNNVSHFSSKVFEQAAGFLRIQGGKNILDSTGIHPERYQAVRDMLSEAGLTPAKAIGGDLSAIQAAREKWAQLIGEYTFQDIINELAKPNRDPRDPFKIFQFREDIHEVKDLKEGMICPGIVTNVTNFGAFVDIGVHQDGLVHISHLSHDFVSDPRLVVSPGQQVQVKVLKVDLEKTQIALSMNLEERPKPAPRPHREPSARTNREPRPTRERDQNQEARAARPSREQRDGSQRARPQERRRPGMLNKSSTAESLGRPQNNTQNNNRQQNNRPQNNKPHNQGPRGPSGKPSGGRSSGVPFNNPFAALTQLKK